jgi:hypothetical protein
VRVRDKSNDNHGHRLHRQLNLCETEREKLSYSHRTLDVVAMRFAQEWWAAPSLTLGPPLHPQNDHCDFHVARAGLYDPFYPQRLRCRRAALVYLYQPPGKQA